MPGTFVITESKNGQFMFNLKAGNGQVILTSEQYKQKRSAKNGIESVRKNSSKDGSFDRLMSKSGKPYFVIKARNGEPIGRSQMYASNSSMEKGIASVRANAPDASVNDKI